MKQERSEFTGGLLGLIGVGLVSSIFILITFGIGLPFAITYRKRWYAKHTYIEGKQLMFIGSGMGLFGQWIKWFFLIIITIGIYSFWVNLKLKQWTIRNTIFNT